MSIDSRPVSERLREAAGAVAAGLSIEEQKMADLLLAIADQAEIIERDPVDLKEQNWTIVFSRAMILAAEIMEQAQERRWH